MAKFNKEQEQALNTRVDENVIIPAGAGSGKTKTLSEKVAKVLTGECGEAISPSQILVLTFTNNAAHEMKSRIIDRCKDLPNIKDEIVSSHIQTFDSFSSYLVGKYSKVIGVPDSINIASEAVMEAKLSTTLDELALEHFRNEPDRYLNIVRKLSLNNDDNLKSVVLDVYKKLDGFLEKDRRSFIDNYESNFLSKQFYDSLVDDIANSFKEKIKQAILEAYLVQEKHDALLSKNATVDSIREVFESNSVSETFFNKDYLTCSFYDKTNKQIYDLLIELIKKPSKDFINECLFHMKNETGKDELFDLSSKAFAKDDKPSKDTYDVFRKIFATQKAICYELKNIFIKDDNDEIDFDKDYEVLISFKDDIKLIFEMVEELSTRMDEYQKSSNSYTFSMINKMSLKLITEHEDIANELREQFRFIMIDEYQDTNDIQECFVDVLTKPRKSDGGVASLFCVGDAKQAIYGFRNSNVALFNRRLNSGTMKIIPLTKNYRSGETVLNEINYIFKYYMTTSHGGIDYNKVGEAMEYDKQVNIYKEPYDGFGIKRIVSKTGVDDDGHKREIWECYAIINDIKQKLKNGFTVSRRGEKNVVEKARLGDFCILMRTKAGYDLYKRIFAKEGIKLNMVYSTNLTEVDAVVVIESLMFFIAYFLGIEECNDPKHYFASLARSYIFQYDDQHIFDLITDEECKPTKELSEAFKNDEIYVKVSDFTANHKDSSFKTIFLDLLKEFQIMEKLYLVGNISDNIAKIESLFTIVTSQEASGEGILDFVKFLKNIYKYDLNFSADTQIDVEDAVNVMTIHASKGLEQKVIYMPYSYNKKGGGGNNNPPYIFSKRVGLILPNNTYEVIEHPEIGEGEVTIKFSNSDTMIKYANKTLYSTNQDDIDEHVRLFYVALTRAENSIYIVGDPKGNDQTEKNNETLYGMLGCTPHYIELTKNGKKAIENRIDAEVYASLVDYINSYKKELTKLNDVSIKDEVNYKAYKNCISKYYEEYRKEELDKKLLRLTDMLFASYYNQVFDAFNKHKLSVNYAASIYAKLVHCKTVDTLEELREYIKSNYDIDNEEVTEDDDTPVYNDDEDSTQKETPIKEIFLSSDEIILTDEAEEFLLNSFIKSFVNNKYKYFGLNYSKSALDKLATRKRALKDLSIALELKELFLPVLAEVFDDVDCFYRTTYHSDDYKDEISIFDISSYEANIGGGEPSIKVEEIKEDDDSPIEFKERIKKKASKILVEHDDDLAKVLDKGTRIHKYMELVDFKTKDTSFITDANERKLIDNVLKMNVFDEINSADKVYKEYPYYDEEFGTTGFIDLMYVKNGEFYIIDYKLKHVKDDGYQNQLATYQRNIKRLFKVDESNIHLNLLSIIDKELL